MDIIAEISNFGLIPSHYLQVTLIPPVVLTLQLIEMTMSSVGNILGIFANAEIPFDPYYFLKKYVPYTDWEDFRKHSEDYARIQQAKASASS